MIRNRKRSQHAPTRRGAWVGLAVAAVALVATASVAGLAKGTTTTAQAKPAPVALGDNATSGRLDVSDAAAYWTPQRMAQAQAVQPAVSTEGSAPSAQGVVDPHSSAGWAPKALGGSQAQIEVGLNGDAQPDGECYHCAVPFTRYFYFAEYKQYPASTVAKIFFTNDGGNYVCSGSVLYTNLVDTAGHCVANTDGTHQWSTNVLVCPSYKAGVDPKIGCWAGSNLWTKTAWKTNGSYEWDFGEIVTSTCGTVNCKPIANVTGFLGYCYGCGYDQNWTALGYPAAAPFDGTKIVDCQSQFGFTDSEGNNQGGPDSASIGCDTTGGTSGGPWIIGWGSSNYLNGHNDWRHTSQTREMNTPYYDSRWCGLINSAGRPCS